MAERHRHNVGAEEAPIGPPIADVAIVGGGPVGLMLACLLVQRGLTIVVLEARVRGSAHSRAIGIHPPGLATLAQIGLADAAIAAGTPIFRGEAWCDGELLGALEIAEASARYPFVLSLPQRETEKLLRERLIELCGGTDPIVRGARVAGFSQRNDAVHIRCESVDGAEGEAGDSSPPTVHARYLVGADGARSRVREHSRIRWSAVAEPQPYVMGDFRGAAIAVPVVETGHGRHGRAAARIAATTALLAFERGGVVESFPLPGGWRRWVVLTERLKAAPTARDLARTVRERTGIDVPLAENDAEDASHTDASLSAFAVQQHFAERMAVGRIALVGDAAHEVSPIGGQGMNLGWLDAAALAPALELALSGGNAVAHRALVEYDRRRRAAAQRAILQASFNMGVGQPASGTRLAMRNAVVRALARPPFRTLLARAFTMRGL